jgi:hypothetical protein
VCDQEGFAAASSFTSLSTASTVAVIGGAVVGTVGAVILVTSKPTSPGGRAAVPAPQRLALSPMAGPAGGGVAAWGSF